MDGKDLTFDGETVGFPLHATLIGVAGWPAPSVLGRCAGPTRLR